MEKYILVGLLGFVAGAVFVLLYYSLMNQIARYLLKIGFITEEEYIEDLKDKWVK